MTSDKNIVYLKDYKVVDYAKLYDKMIVIYNKCNFFPELNGLIGKITSVRKSKSNLAYIISFNVYEKDKLSKKLIFKYKINIDSNMNKLCYKML